MHDRPAPLERLPLAAILAGGASRRFGAPKPFADLAGRPLLAWVRDAVTRGVGEPVVITNDPAPFQALGLRCLPDAVRGAGPLGGLLSALLRARQESRQGALCVACDTPFLAPGLLRRLVEEFARSDADLLTPQSSGPLQVEPLCGVYHVRCIPEIRRRLEIGEHALGSLVAGLAAERLPLEEVRRYGDPEVLFLNVNTREQHARAVRIARQLAASVISFGSVDGA